MNVLEVAIYAMVLSAAQPQAFDCLSVQPEGVNCTNGLSAIPRSDSVIEYSTGTQVIKDAQGRLSFSNGTTTYFDSSGWVAFKDARGKTLVSVRKTGPFTFKFSNGFICRMSGKDEERAGCQRR